MTKTSTPQTESRNGQVPVSIPPEPQPEPKPQRPYWLSFARVSGYAFAASLGVCLALLVAWVLALVLMALLFSIGGGGAGD